MPLRMCGAVEETATSILPVFLPARITSVLPHCSLASFF